MISIIVPTGPAPIQSLKWALISLLFRSDISKIDQIIVSINGPDSRTGNTSLQDEKELFCKQLKADGFPITIIRTWSRVGYSQPIQVALPLIKTELYLLMHDDVIILNNSWQKEAEKWMADPSVLAMLQPAVFSQKLQTSMLKKQIDFAELTTYLPTFNTFFSLFRKSSNLPWSEYYVLNDNQADLQSINNFYFSKKKCTTILVDQNFSENSKKLSRNFPSNDLQLKSKIVKYNVGAWATYFINLNGKIATFSNAVHHHKNVTAWEAENPDAVTLKLLSDIKGTIYSKYYKHKTNNIPDISDLRPLICVIVYDRVEPIKHWLKAWKVMNQCNGKLLIVQNTDGSKKCNEIAKMIADLEPDYHWVRKNDNNSLKHLFELLAVKEVDYDWNILVGFTDDCIPIRKDCLVPILSAFKYRENVGITGGSFSKFDRSECDLDEYHQRSICMGINRKALNAIKDIPKQYGTGLLFSIKTELLIWKWIKDAGFTVSPCKHDWSLVYGWDTDHQGIEDLWEEANYNMFGADSKIYHLQ